MTVRGFVVALLLASAAMIVIGGFARAHDAGEGWQYPMDCCSNADCHMVSAEDLRENADGSWDYLPLGLHYVREKVRPSGNGHFHACWSPAAPHYPYCVFILQGS